MPTTPQPYRINISHHTCEDGRPVALMLLSVGPQNHVRLYCDLDVRRVRMSGPLWGRVTLWNECWSYGNKSCFVDGIDAQQIVREALGPLDFSLAAQIARKAAAQQVAA